MIIPILESSDILEIGDYAFGGGCESLISIQWLQNNNTLLSLGSMVFADCTKLIQVMAIPNTVHTIPSGTFLNCHSLIHLEGTNLTSIQDSAFRNCTSLKYIRLNKPTIETTIGNYAFANCIHLISIEFSLGSSSDASFLLEIGDYAFSSCHVLKNICLPLRTTKLGRWIFADCDCWQDYSTTREIPELLQCRWDGLPLHQICYYQDQDQDQDSSNNDSYNSKKLSALDHLYQVMKQQEQQSHVQLIDCFGCTPFHILALSYRPNKNLWMALLQQYNKDDVPHWKDHWGYSSLDYLYMRRNDKSRPTIQDLINSVVRNPSVWTNGRSRY